VFACSESWRDESQFSYRLTGIAFEPLRSSQAGVAHYKKKFANILGCGFSDFLDWKLFGISGFAMELG
jgi:hypothetical protein